MLKFLFIKTIIILLAKISNKYNNNTAIITITYLNKANLYNFIPGVFILAIVIIKFINFNKLLTLNKCKVKIARFILGLL